MALWSVDPVSKVDYFAATAHKVRCTRPTKLLGNFGPVICWATGFQQLLGAVGQGLAGALAAVRLVRLAVLARRGGCWHTAICQAHWGGALLPIGIRPFLSCLLSGRFFVPFWVLGA